MAKVKGKVEMKIVDLLRGVLDFYPRGNETIVRTWPRNKGNSQTPASLAWVPTFVCFHKLWREFVMGLDLSRYDVALLYNWTLRDFYMSRFYGKLSDGYRFLYDNRDPLPAPCPDPLHRFFCYHGIGASFSLINWVRIYHKLTPAWGQSMLLYDTPPSKLTRYVTKRGVRHKVASDFTPTSRPRYVAGMWPTVQGEANFYSQFYWDIGRPCFYLVSHGANYLPPLNIIPIGPKGITVSPWYYFVPRRGSPPLTPLWYVEGPFPFTDYVADKYRELE